jgi:hypothetical protein
MKICLLDEAEVQKAQDPDFVPDCHSHDHLSKPDARQAAADGKVRFVSPRAVVVLSPVPLTGYWYDEAVNKNDRYLGTAKSGQVRTTQLLKFMPRGRKRRVTAIGACGAETRGTSQKQREESVILPSNTTGLGIDFELEETLQIRDLGIYPVQHLGTTANAVVLDKRGKR